jgi:hypothetical protein
MGSIVQCIDFLGFIKVMTKRFLNKAMDADGFTSRTDQ